MERELVRESSLVALSLEEELIVSGCKIVDLSIKQKVCVESLLMGSPIGEKMGTSDGLLVDFHRKGIWHRDLTHGLIFGRRTGCI